MTVLDVWDVYAIISPKPNEIQSRQSSSEINVMDAG